MTGFGFEDILGRAAAEGAEEYARLAAAAPPGMVPIVLVPVEVFGTDDCCEHSPDGYPEDPDAGPCKSTGYGLCDAVSAWSDCNRAIGQIYRVDEYSKHRNRESGETVVVYVPAEHREWFEKQWGGT